jgi:hypothetical protein
MSLVVYVSVFRHSCITAQYLPYVSYCGHEDSSTYIRFQEIIMCVCVPRTNSEMKQSKMFAKNYIDV